ncbi:hypothetical protein PENANT_c040G01357 [Penicillium antarcticum]|uniref:Uncharacterized protein n=1 Tax=Penicillium antarcticum TaxID=416450 RepID=A0A1V6PSN1_9EURO|nr:hypothetical protein PENANT_c040G01357 [Penicillium antarcticum]
MSECIEHKHYLYQASARQQGRTAGALQQHGPFQAMHDNITNTTGAELVDPLVWAYNVTCLQDSNGFCNPKMFNSSSTLDACSDCVLSYVAHMLESDYGRVRFNDKSFSIQLSSCDVPATKYPYTAPTSAPISSSTASG